jgi:anti-anti-sigma regulatory factor
MEMENMAESEQGKKQALALEGELGIQRAEEIHQALLQGLQQSQWLEVDLSGAREVGLCCLQLLYSAHLSARQQGKSLTIRPGVSPEFKKAVARSGIMRQPGPGGLRDDARLWNTED